MEISHHILLSQVWVDQINQCQNRAVASFIRLVLTLSHYMCYPYKQFGYISNMKPYFLCLEISTHKVHVILDACFFVIPLYPH